MILQNSKSEFTGFSLMQLLGSTSKENGSSEFALLLKQLGIDTEAMKVIGNAPHFLDISHLEKQELPTLQLLQERKPSEKNSGEILKLLEGIDLEMLEAQDEIILLNTKLVETYSDKDVKQIVADAKGYLKDQINELAKLKGIEIDIETLPKTLQSLSLVAQKIGVQLDKITLETLQTKVPNLQLSDKQASVLQAQSKPVEYSTQEFVRFKNDQTQNLDANIMKVAQETPKNEPLKALLHVPIIDKKILDKQKVPTEVLHTTEKTEVSSEVRKNTVVNQSVSEVILRTAQNIKTVFSTAPSNSTVSSGDTIEAMVRPVERLITNSKVDATVELNSLLRADENTATDGDEPKSDTKIVSGTMIETKTVPLELKVKEAKQMVSYLAVDLKDAVENYKPPFTRIKLQLNPVKLGEVDVTMIQRGNNVHINISSNNSAIALLAQNSVELKNQLANNGLSSATMQFNTSGGEQQRQSQHQHNMMEAYEKYANFENEESFETLTSIELIVPRYV